VTAQAAAGPLLTTKFHAPDPRDRVTRDGVLSRLTGAQQAKLVLIRAPAGWGKTTLLAQWLLAEAARRRFAWVTLDRRDSDPVRFWTYAIEALRRLDPRIGAGSLAFLAVPRVNVARDVLPVLLGELAHLPAPVVLALEDYHSIEGEPVHATVRALLQDLPGTVTLAIATRSEPPLSLARLRARGQLVELDVRALRFSLQDSTTVLNEVHDLNLDREDVRRLHERAEGWPAGLYLAALSLGNRSESDRTDFIAGFAGSDRPVADYLMEAVLLAQEPEVRQFLVRTSMLDRLTGGLCDAVLDTAGSAATLDRLARSNLLLVELDERREWFRYHQLLRARLDAELAREDSSVVADLHRRAAEWHLAHGDLSEAIRHTIAAGDFGAAAELVARHWAARLMVTAGERTVEEWCAAMPNRVLASDLRLCVARSYAALSMGRMDVAERWLTAAETAPLPAPFRDGFSSARGAVACVRAGYQWQSGDVAAAMSAAEEVLAAETGSSPWRGVGHAVIALTYAAHGMWEQARASMAAWVEIGRRSGQGEPQISGLAYGAAWSTELQDWERATADAEASLRLAAELGYEEHWICACAHFARGRVLERSDQLDRAKVEMRRALVLARRGAGPVTTAWLLTHLVRLLVTCRDPAGARACLEEAQAVLAGAPDAAAVSGMVAAAGRHLSRAIEDRSGEALSDRERDVLRLLATTLTQREIGAELYLSLNTVKSHTRSIFRKLGASGREQAVARARELNLI
jgi:ATP/maltotriose-dependent transcriptional regulator MalT